MSSSASNKVKQHVKLFIVISCRTQLYLSLCKMETLKSRLFTKTDTLLKFENICQNNTCT